MNMPMIRASALVLLFAARIAAAAVTDAVFLVGDAGMHGENDAVLRALCARTSPPPPPPSAPAASRSSSSATTCTTMASPNEQNTAELRGALKRLRGEVRSAAVNGGVRVFFVPGNHDWDQQGPAEELARVRRQAAELAAMNVQSPRARLSPVRRSRNAGARLQILFLDTQWWLHEFDKPTTTCSPARRTASPPRSRWALANAGGRMTIVVAHHPLTSAGPHGRDTRTGANEQDQQNGEERGDAGTPHRSVHGSAAAGLGVGSRAHAGGAEEAPPPGISSSAAPGTPITRRWRSPNPARGNWLFAFPREGQSLAHGGYMRLDVPDTGAPSLFVITVDPLGVKQTRFVQRLD